MHSSSQQFESSVVWTPHSCFCSLVKAPNCHEATVGSSCSNSVSSDKIGAATKKTPLLPKWLHKAAFPVATNASAIVAVLSIPRLSYIFPIEAIRNWVWLGNGSRVISFMVWSHSLKWHRQMFPKVWLQLPSLAHMRSFSSSATLS